MEAAVTDRPIYNGHVSIALCRRRLRQEFTLLAMAVALRLPASDRHAEAATTLRRFTRRTKTRPTTRDI